MLEIYVMTYPPGLAFVPSPWRFAETWRPPISNKDYGDRNVDGNVFWGYSISGSNEYGAHILPTLAAVHNFPDQIHANARLIASAPDLLAALEELVAHLPSTNPDVSLTPGTQTRFANARAAIIKATTPSPQ